MLKDPRTDADMRTVIWDYEWVSPVDEAGNPVPNIKIKTMGKDPVEPGCYTRMILLEPGFRSDAVSFELGFGSHEYWKENLIIEGTLMDYGVNKMYTKGYYGLFEPNTIPGPYGTENGCMILETTWYDADWYRSHPRKDESGKAG